MRTISEQTVLVRPDCLGALSSERPDVTAFQDLSTSAILGMISTLNKGATAWAVAKK